MEILSGKQIKGVSPNPKNTVNLISNINLALETLRQDGLKGLSVSGQQIADKNIKVI